MEMRIKSCLTLQNFTTLNESLILSRPSSEIRWLNHIVYKHILVLSGIVPTYSALALQWDKLRIHLPKKPDYTYVFLEAMRDRLWEGGIQMTPTKFLLMKLLGNIFRVPEIK